MKYPRRARALIMVFHASTPFRSCHFTRVQGAARIFSRASGGQASLGKMGCVSGNREKGKRVKFGGYGDIHPPADWRIL